MAFPVVRVCVTVVGLVQGSFPVRPGQWLLLQFMRVSLHVVRVLPCLVVGAS